MSAEAVKSEILEPMQRQFYPPKQNMPAADQAAALRDYVMALQGFDEEDLRAAWADVRATHTKPSWPLVAIFVTAARAARKLRMPEAAIGHRRREETNYTQRWEVWKGVCRSRLAQEACARNVAWSLKCAILGDGKMPEDIDLRDMEAGKDRAAHSAELIRRNEPVPHFRAGRPDVVFSPQNASVALDLWDRLLVREVETQAEINYGRVMEAAE
jgi:hypothetical protein